MLDFLACPSCGKDLLLDIHKKNTEVEEGILRCGCGKSYAVINNVPRFVDGDTYLKNFSLQWQLHSKTQLDTELSDVSERDFIKKTGLRKEDVKGKLVLDVGCGMGRFMDVVEKWGGQVIGIDLSYSVESAFDNLGRKEKVHIIQADASDLPFREETFDIIYSIGVLHHAPDCKKAFLNLPRYLKANGYLCTWVYSNYDKPRAFMSDKIRIITTKIPKRLLYYLCFLSVPLYFLYRIPVVGHVARVLFPISMRPKWDWRVLDTFDWYSPKYQSKHRYPEVFSWFKEAGLKNIELLEPPVAVRGQKI